MKKAFLKWSINIGLLGLLSSCSFSSVSMSQGMLNGRYNNEQVTLSANGKWLALVSDRSGTPRLMLYNLSEQRFVDLPFINTDEAVVESPSLSRTGTDNLGSARLTLRTHTEKHTRKNSRIAGALIRSIASRRHCSCSTALG